MRLVLIAAGRLKAGPERALVDTYAARLRPAPASLGPLCELEIDERKTPRPDDLAGEYTARVPKGARTVALDETGKALTTRALAKTLEGWRDDGVMDTAFLIGPADGLPAQTRASCDLTLCLGALTWPHMLARVLIAEQLYRAASLLAGHPYHRD